VNGGRVHPLGWPLRTIYTTIIARFRRVLFGFVEKGNPLYLISRSRLMPALTLTLTLPTATDPATDPNRFATDVNPNPGNASPSLIR